MALDSPLSSDEALSSLRFSFGSLASHPGGAPVSSIEISTPDFTVVTINIPKQAPGTTMLKIWNADDGPRYAASVDIVTEERRVMAIDTLFPPEVMTRFVLFEEVSVCEA